MLRHHHRDLSIGSYVLIGSLLLGIELFGLWPTIRVALCLAGLLVAVTLAGAAFAHARRTARERCSEIG